MIKDIEQYFANGCGRCQRFETDGCSARVWRDGLAILRKVCLDQNLQETVKWGQPCYMHAGRNIAIIGALRDAFCLGFFEASLMRDTEGILEKQGANTEYANTIRFQSAARVTELEATIARYLREAMNYAEAGLREKKPQRDMTFPDELVEALDADPELAEAFNRLTPSRQKSYLINLSGTKKSETRVARIVKFRPKIIAGKGATEY